MKLMEEYFHMLEDYRFVRALDSIIQRHEGYAFDQNFCCDLAMEYTEIDNEYFGEKGVRFSTLYPQYEEEIVTYQDFYVYLCIYAKEKGLDDHQIKEKLKQVKYILKINCYRSEQ